MAESDLIRGNVDTIILKVLYEGDRYGYDLIKQINARGDGQWEIKQPTVYACLKRLEKQGFISSYWGTSESDGGRRKYYTLTDSGKEVFLKYKNEFERASALFGGLISGNDSMFMSDDYSDIEDETYTVSKRPRPRKPKLKQEHVANIVQSHDTVDPDAYAVTYTENHVEPVEDKPLDEEQAVETEKSENSEGVVIFEDDEHEEDKLEDNGAVILDENETSTLAEEKQSDDEDDDEQYFNDLIALAESLSQSDEELEKLQAEQAQSQVAIAEPQQEKPVVHDVPPAREPIDPKAIIDSYYKAEHGESYSDVHSKAVYSETQQQPAQTVVSTAPVPAPVVQTPPPAPIQSREVAPAKPTPTPAVSTIGFPDPDESQARKEYKTVLTDLVERLEIASPAVRDEQAAATDRAEAPAPQSEEDKQFGKIKNTARDLGNDIQVTAHNNSAKQYAHKYYYYSNRLLMTHYTIMCVAMFLIGLTLFLTFYAGLKVRMPYDYLLYMAAGLFPIIMFIITVIRYAGNPDKRKRVNLNMGVSIFVRCIIMLQVAVVIYCVNLIWGMPVGFSYNYLPSLIIPLAYSIFIPISKIIFSTLLRSGSYAVE